MQPENLDPVPAGASPEELILRNFAAAIGRRRYEHWFHQKTRFRVEGDELVISVTNPFLVTWLPQNFRPALMAAAQPVLGLSANVRFEVASENGAELAPATGPSALKAVLQQSAVTQAPATSNRRSTTAAPRSESKDSRPVESRRPEPRADVPSPAEKPVPAVLRVKKEPQLAPAPTAAPKGKPTEDVSARPSRRYADLMEFVEGSCNEFALSAARQVSLAPGAQFTTLFVHGPVGVGKTHILEGICREVKTRFASRQVVYLTAEAFANFFTQALREHKLPSFRQRFRSVDVLIIDDIDFLVGKPGIQEEFLYTLQQLESHGRQAVVAAHGHPRLLTKMSDELRTRFLAGMVCRIDAPDATTRRRILETKAMRNGIEFTPEIYQFVSDRFRNNVRELEGAFNTLCAYQRMQGRKLSVTAARQVLADLERDCIRVVRLADIEQAVCSLFGVSVEDIKSAKRQKSLSQPRMLAMYLARKHTRSAYAEIGDFFGGRNHSTVIAAEKKIKASLDEDEPIKIHTQTWRVNDLIEALEQQLQAG
jgi:chromosomal replication initiator protein